MISFITSPAYQNTLLPPVEAAIRQLHNTVGNADTDGYTIVHGVGATNVLYMTITALSKSIIDVSISELLNSRCPCFESGNKMIQQNNKMSINTTK